MLGRVWPLMASTQTASIEAYVPQSVGGHIVGGLLTTVLALLQLYLVSATGLLASGVLVVVWPLVGGAVAATIELTRGHETALAGVLAGAYGAFVLTVVVFLAGIAGLWSAGIHLTFGVSLWPVVFTVLVVTGTGWTVFGYVGGYLASQFGG